MNGTTLRLIEGQRRLSRRLDLCLPTRWHTDPFLDFRAQVVSKLIPVGGLIYDVGGGRRPFLSPVEKAQWELRVVGLDLDKEELRAAPAGYYDREIVADICDFAGDGDGDLVLCHTVIEHVPDARLALRGMRSLLRPGGFAALFAPNRNALFAQLNRLLPETWKRRVLNALWPADQGSHGFRAYYDRCSPAAIAAASRGQGWRIVSAWEYFQCYYFSFCFPLHCAWRLWSGAAVLFRGSEAAEYFAVLLQNSPAGGRA